MKSSSHFPTVGIIGAGQMARMLVESASRLNLGIKLLSKSATESAALISNHVTVGDAIPIQIYLYLHQRLMLLLLISKNFHMKT